MSYLFSQGVSRGRKEKKERETHKRGSQGPKWELLVLGVTCQIPGGGDKKYKMGSQRTQGGFGGWHALVLGACCPLPASHLSCNWAVTILSLWIQPAAVFKSYKWPMVTNLCYAKARTKGEKFTNPTTWSHLMLFLSDSGTALSLHQFHRARVWYFILYKDFLTWQIILENLLRSWKMMCEVLGHTKDQHQRIWGTRETFRKLNEQWTRKGK